MQTTLPLTEDHLFSQGDPLADAVVEDWKSANPSTRALLTRGLHEGVQALTRAPASFAALLRDAELATASAPAASWHRAAEHYLVVGPQWISLTQGLGALVYTYANPQIAGTLMRTGKLSGAMASRRLQETLIWNLQLLKPDGLAVGGSGYIHTLQVRLLHARARAGLLGAGHGATAPRPIDQKEMVHTWLGFSVVALSALQTAGFDHNEETLADIFCLWQLVGRLLGIHPKLLKQMNTPDLARQMLARIHADGPQPSAESLALTHAMLEPLSQRLAATMQLPPEVTQLLAHALVRLYHGDELADRLALSPNWTAALLPMLFDANRYRQQRAHQDPAFRASLIAQSRQAILTLEAGLQGPTAYQTGSTV